MKKATSIIIICFICVMGFSQNSNDYPIEKAIKVTHMNLKITSAATYVSNGEKKLIGVSLSRHNDSISYLFKQYDVKDTIGDSRLSYRELFLKNAIEIPSSTFDSIVSQLKQIDIEKVNNSKDYNIMDGKTYSLNFSGDGYQITTTANTPEAQTKQRGLEQFLKVSKMIWNLTE